MFDKLIAFFMSIIAFFMSLFGISSGKGVTVMENVSYGTEERQIVDIAFPEKASGNMGLVLMIHGGAWYAGDKDGYADAIKTGAKSGYVCAAMNYRYISEKSNINDIMDDITAALGVIKQKAAEKDINIGNVLLTGSSAGAHLSLLYAYSRKAEAPIIPAAVVAYCPPTNLADLAGDNAEFFANNALGDAYYMAALLSYASGYTLTAENFAGEEAQTALKAISPLYYAASGVPTVICHGKKDNIVPFSQAAALDEALTASRVKHDFVVLPNSGHGLDSDPAELNRANDLLYSYAEMYLK